MGKKMFRHPVLMFVIIIILFILLIKPTFITVPLGSVIRILSPVFIGMAIAFVMNRPVFRLEKIYRGMSKSASPKLVTVLAVFTGYFIFTGLLVGIIGIIVPHLLKSVSNLFSNFDVYYENFMGHVKTLESRDTLGIISAVSGFLNSFTEKIPVIIETAAAKAPVVIVWLVNLVVGFIISIYILADKQNIKKAAAAITRAFTSPTGFERVGRYYRLIFDTFTRFVSGQVTESIILGLLCYFGMRICRFDYALLISTIVGFTALIPVVGAFIGTIPSAFLLFLVEPMQAVWFIVFIIILQQLENNLIYPKVVGKSLGLPSLLVLIAILIGAGVGGIVGILLGVPLAAVFYAVICDYVNVKNGTDKCETWQRGDEVV